MKAIVFEEIDKVKLADVEKPQIKGPGDAIVRVTLTTICGSDIHMIHGAAPMMPGNVLGHEFVGVVEELGDRVEGFEAGDRVAVTCTPTCGKCEMCLKGLAAKCVNGGIFGCGPMFGDLGGSQAEYIRVPHAQFGMHKIPESLTDEQALLVGDILSTGYFAVINGKTTPGDTVAIFGGGPVGLCATVCAKLFSPSNSDRNSTLGEGRLITSNVSTLPASSFIILLSSLANPWRTLSFPTVDELDRMPTVALGAYLFLNRIAISTISSN